MGSKGPLKTFGTNRYTREQQVRSQLELKGYIIFDESSKLTKDQMEYLMKRCHKVKGYAILALPKGVAWPPPEVPSVPETKPE
jgi:hypothetical protein